MTGSRGSRGRAHLSFLLFVAVCLASAAAFIVHRSGRSDPSVGGANRGESSPSAELPSGGIGANAGRAGVDAGTIAAGAAAASGPALDAIRAQPHVYFRSYRPGEFGRVVVAALAAPNETRVITPIACDRVDFGRRHGICLVSQPDVVGAPAVARIYDKDFKELAAFPLAGTPIRTRLSPDERFAAATVFVTGERYDADFTTRTMIIDTETLKVLGDLEQFEARRNGRPFSRIDFNYWGVTFFNDANRFYATLGYTGTRFLVRGDVTARQLTVMRDNVECPSLSPDGQLVAFKSMLADTREWRPHVLDVESGREWAISGETRNIDDQLEWLDGAHVLYQFTAERGLPGDAVNVWMSSAAANASDVPRLFIRGASSPAVVRPE